MENPPKRLCRKNCLACSYRTIEYYRFSLTNNKTFQKTEEGLTCSRCGCLLCKDCATILYQDLAKQRTKFHTDCSPFLNGLETYVLTNGKKHPKPFIGHCCMISVMYPPRKKGNQVRNTVDIEDCREGTFSIGGSFCLPEFKLLIPIDEKGMDVFGVGKDEEADARWHYVIDEKHAAEIHSRGVFPSHEMPSSWTCVEKNLNIQLPHDLNHKRKKTFSVRIFYVPKLEDIDTERHKGRNDISDDEVNDFYYFQSSYASKCDVTMIVGYEDGKAAGNLLLCRFHTMPPILSRKKKQTPKTLLQDLQLLLKNNGLERRRTGGSSGLVQYSNELKLLLQTRNTTPRCSKGAVFLKDRNCLKFHVFYIGTKEGDLKYTYYTNPVPGGSFKMCPDLMTKYNCLLKFASVRPIAALLLEDLKNSTRETNPTAPVRDSTRETNPTAPVRDICMVAVKQELEYIDHARAFVRQFVDFLDRSKKEMWTPHKIDILFYEFYTENYQNYTLVMHPTGGHLDVFADGRPSLETRMCFSFPLSKNGTTNIWNTGNGNGRGGAGMRNYCYALIDWNASSRDRRSAWTDPRNADLPHSAQHYARENENGRTRLTGTIWNLFRANGNRIQLPQNVDNLDALDIPAPQQNRNQAQRRNRNRRAANRQ